MTQRDDFVAIQVAQAGVLQYEFGCRCDWRCGQTDCSGLCSGAAQRVGCDVGPGCPNSVALSRRCHEAPRPQWMNDRYGPDPWTGRSDIGTGISIDQAEKEKGAVKFHGAEQGAGNAANGAGGHVGTSMGDGRSIEALSHALDVRVWVFRDPKITYCALLPGMTGFDSQPGGNGGPANAWEASTMGMIPIPVPGAHVQMNGPRKGSMPLVAAISKDGITWAIACFNGASIEGKELIPLGKLNKPIEAADVIYVEDAHDHLHPAGKKHLIPSRTILFTAGDGGTFGPYRPDVHYA